MSFTRITMVRVAVLLALACFPPKLFALDCETIPPPSVSVTFSGMDDDGLASFSTTWSFPAELADVDSSNRKLELWMDGVHQTYWGGPNAAMSGTIDWEMDFSCKEPGPKIIQVRAIGCGQVASDSVTIVVPDKQPIISQVEIIEDPVANYTITATAEFPNTKTTAPYDGYRYTVFELGDMTSPERSAPKYGDTFYGFETLCWPSGPTPLKVTAIGCGGAGARTEVHKSTITIPDKTPTVDLSVYTEPDGLVVMTQNYHFPVWKTVDDSTWWVHIYRNDGQKISPDYWWAQQSGTRVMGTYFPKDKKGVNVLRAVASFCAGSAEDVKSVPPVQASCDTKPKEPSGVPAAGSPVSSQPVSSCPDCVDSPIHLGSGNMRMNDLDPVAGEIQLDRTYDSQDSGSHLFGRGWWSLFDSKITSVRSGQFLVVSDLAGDQFTFEDRDGALVQIDPSPRIHRVELEHDPTNAVWRFGSADSEIRQVYRTTDGKLVGFDLAGGRSYTVGWSADVPTSVSDSWGNWNLTVNTNAEGRISSIVSPNGTWTYEYATTGHLTRVALDAVTWRTYTYSSTYASAVMTAAHDAAGKLIESHSYSAGRAISSITEENAVTNITWVTGRVPGEFAAQVTDGAGSVTTYYTRHIGGRTRTVEIDGTCDCGTDDTVFGFEEDGDLAREQNARGYITERSFDGFGKVLSETTAMKPVGCDPETDLNHCRLSPDSILTATLETTGATRTVNYEYGDPNWPTAVTRISRSSVLTPGQESSTTFTYDAETGQILVQNDTGWTGSPAQLETRTTTTTLYDGTEGAVFNPGGAFQSGWLTLAQPAGFRKRVDGPRSDVTDVTELVYYPVDASVPSGSRGKLAAVRNAAGHITRYENYDALGNAQRIVDTNGVVTERTFDTLGRLVSTTTLGVFGCDTTLDPLCSTDITTTRSYAGLGPLESDTTADGSVTAWTLDDRGRTTTLDRGPSAGTMLERMSYDYDPATGLKSADRTLGWNGSAWVQTRSQTFDYDSSGQLLSTTFPTGDTVSYQYDSARNLIATTDENNTSANTLYVYDPANRLTEVRQLLAGAWITTRYGYDADGNLVSVTDPNGNITTYLYDDFGQMIQQSSPVTGTTTYDYDTAGNLVTTTDSRGATAARTYDVLGRTLSSTTTLGAETEQVGWTWDIGTFGIGRLASISDELGTVDYTYTRFGQLAREQRSIYGAVYTTAYVYDQEGNRTRLAYPSGLVVETDHDYAGRPVSASTPGGATYVTSAEYEPFGPMKSLVYGNGTQKVVSHDTRYRPQTIEVTGPAGPVAEWGYSYDGVGNITGIADALDARFSRTFGYDDLNRLTQANTGVALWGTASYTYDAMGNMLSATLGPEQRSFTYQGTTPKLATSSDFTGTTPVSYDSAGNEVARSATTFDYSSRNNLGETAGLSYRYDGRGLRLVTAGSTGSIAMVASSLVEIEGGEAATGTVTLTQPAPAGGAVVELISSSSDLTIPSSVTVPEGATSALFTISAAYAAETVPAVVTARWGSTASVAVSVRAMPAVTGIQLTPNDVGGGSSSSATVTLDRPAPSIGTEVTLTSSDVSAATVPASVTVTDGQSTAIFTVDTSVVENTTTSLIRGTTLSGTGSATLTIRRSIADLASIDLGSGSVVSGYPTTGSVVLTAPAPAGGAAVALESTDPVNAPVPAEVTVPEGQTSVPFTIATRPLTSSSSATISGTFGLTQASTLTLLACAVPTMHPGPSSFPQDDSVWSDDIEPGGTLNWIWSTEQAVSGTKSHTNSQIVAGANEHQFHDAAARFVGPSDTLFTYAMPDPCNPTRAIMISWQDEAGSWEHRAYWGENLFTVGTDGTASRKRMGDLPEVGEWARLEVSSADVGLSGKSVTAMRFATYDGRVWFDRAGFGICHLEEVPPPADFGPADEIWIEDAHDGAYWNWQWVSDQKASGNLSHGNDPTTGHHQHGFRDATKITPGAGDSFAQYVLLDPCNPPREIMLQFRVGSSWNYRAYWGENLINYGTPGTSSRVYMGELPPAGQWVRLEIPAEWVGLANLAVNGMAFDIYDGRVWWDYSAVERGSTYDNAAWNRYATQSSTEGSAAATIATDGITSGNGSLGQVSMTNVEVQPWWEIDLGSVHSIHRIDIWNRTDANGADLSDYYVLVSDDPFASADLAAMLAQSGVTSFHVPGESGDVRRMEVEGPGRYVRIQLSGTAALQLAEVQIEVSGWQNIAVGRTATQISTANGGVASRAVDGNRSGNWANGSVTHTAAADQPWWEVDLGAVELIEAIWLWNRTDCCGYRLSNYHVFVSDVPFVSGVLAEVKSQAGVLDLYNSGGNGSNRKFGVGRTGRYVRVQLEARDYLTIAETEIYVNPTGGQALLLSGDEEVLVTAIAPRLDIEAVADDQLIVDSKSGMTPTLRPSFFRGPLETLPGAMRVVVSWANRQTVEHALAIDAISDGLASDALAESTLREERRGTSGERRGGELASLGLSDQAGVVGSAESVTGERRYSLYSPEMNLLSETEYTDASTPPIQYDYVWFAGAPVAQVTHSVPSEPLPSPEVVWTVTDHLGTPRIQTDSTGAIVWHAEHEPYGRIYLLREGEGRHQPLRFPGQEAEQLGVNAANGITDRNYNIFRWYRASEGRYTQADPLGPRQEQHSYSFGDSNPIALTDKLGLYTTSGSDMQKSLLEKAMQVLTEELKKDKCGDCKKYFKSQPNQDLTDIDQWTEPGGPPFLRVVPRPKNLGSSAKAHSQAGKPWWYSWIYDQNFPPSKQRLNPCDLASLILHEVGHLARQDTGDNEPSDFFKKCKVGCLNPGKWK